MTHAPRRPTFPTRGLCTRPHAALTARPHGGLVLPHEEAQVRPASRTEHGPQTHNRPPDALAQPSRCSELPGPKPGRPDGRHPAPALHVPRVRTPRPAGRASGATPPRPAPRSGPTERPDACPAHPAAPLPPRPQPRPSPTCRPHLPGLPPLDACSAWLLPQRGTASACSPHGALTSNPAPRTRPASPPPVARVPPTLRAGGFLPESPAGTARGPRDRVNTRAQQPPQRPLTRVSI